jgi:hypothetical protein
LDLKNIKELPKETLFNFLKLDKNQVLVNSNFETGMFMMIHSKPISLLKKGTDVELMSESLSRDIFFKLYPEFNNEYYQNNLKMESIHSLMNDIPFNI